MVREPLRQSDVRLPPDVHNILVVYAHNFLSLRALDPRVTERTKMAFEMKDRLDQLRHSSVRVTVRAAIYRRESLTIRSHLN